MGHRRIHGDPGADYRFEAGEFWHQTQVVGGWAMFNHLNGEIRLLREVPEPLLIDATKPDELPPDHKWHLVSAPAVACRVLKGDRGEWPNLWGLRHRQAREFAVHTRYCGGLGWGRGEVYGIGVRGFLAVRFMAGLGLELGLGFRV